MKIINCGPGVHQREIVGVARLQTLPSHWYAYTNLDLAISRGISREIDVIMILDDRIFLIDLKDWGGEISSRDGNWYHNDKYRGMSPVFKINENVKKVYQFLSVHLQRHSKGKKTVTPLIQGLVVITGGANLGGISTMESECVLSIDEFLSSVVTAEKRVKVFGAVNRQFADNPLTSPDWRSRLSTFFNVKTGIFKPGQRNYGGFFAESDRATFEHSAKIYVEYDAADINAPLVLGTLRVWDFTRADVRFQTELGRSEIVGRERNVIAYLQDRGEEYESSILQIKAEDQERGVDYWEVYDRRLRLKRLQDFAATESLDLLRDNKLELARQIISKVKSLHVVNAAHHDLGGHSIWLQQPSTVKLSHLMSASYPQIESLGETRYQFLASSSAPEVILGGGIDPKRKDVFLVGVAVHILLFGRPPENEHGDMPPEWSSTVDTGCEYKDLYVWFEKALSLDPGDRYSDASVALDAFNAAIASRPSTKEVISGLEKFRTKIHSQLQLIQNYPLTNTLKDDEYSAIWKSVNDGGTTFVKMWKRACWGDQSREAPRILDFLTRARDLQRAQLPDVPAIRDVLWLGDAIVLVQDCVDAPNLAQAINTKPELWGDAIRVLNFLLLLTTRVIRLHERGVSHGDLKPQNILIASEEEPQPIFVDVVDFSSIDDGEIKSSAYAPQQGGRLERDRYATTKIAEELLAICPLKPELAAKLTSAITECRTKTPLNGTLLPLKEALESALTPPQTAKRQSIHISIVQAKTGPVLPDEGLFYFQRARNGKLVIRGACEEIEITLNEAGKPRYGLRRSIDQRSIAARTKYDFMSVELDINVIGSASNDFAELGSALDTPEFKRLWKAQSPAVRSESGSDVETLTDEGAGDIAIDSLAEEVSSETIITADIDIAQLWQRLIDVERELSTEGTASSESAYKRNIDRHVVPFELDRGVLDFDQNDRVLVERLDRNGRWRRIGHLDIQQSRPDFVVIDATRFALSRSARLVEEAQRLRFVSHYTTVSRQRRESAVSRVLARQSQVSDLIDIFDPTSRKLPWSEFEQIDPTLLKEKYLLNDAQAVSLSTLLSVRPVGLLQGPPGTGKTVFIAALVHYALTQGLARNVLLVSQSHEAVNNAGEAVLKLFAKNKEHPSFLRVGHEGVVSQRLLPYHTDRAERLYKDRFQAAVKERLKIGGRALGISETLVSDVIYIETVVAPTVEKLTQFESTDEPNKQKVESIRGTINSQLIPLGLEGDVIENVPGDRIVTALIEQISERVDRRERVSPNKIAKLRSLAQLARDFIGSVSTAQRSFETFLAGTRQIVAGTCVGLGRSTLGLTTTPFDLVVVDEAARCTASELSVPIQAGRWIVLVGDHRQLEPTHEAEVVTKVGYELKAAKREILRSDFDRIFGTPYGVAAGQKLNMQYRMLPPIGRVVSTSFYNGELKHGREDPEINPSALPPGLDKPLYWIETDSIGVAAHERAESTGTSRVNETEVELIVTLLKQWSDYEPFIEWLTSQTKYVHPVGIICTYASQRDRLRKRVQLTPLNAKLKSSIKIDTVDSYQGKENPIVLLSLVRNNTDGRLEDGVATIKDGFLSRPNRINVAMSRAMDRLVIVGARSRWRSGGPVSRVIESFNQELEAGNASVVDGTELLIPDSILEKKTRKSSKKSPSTPNPIE